MTSDLIGDYYIPYGGIGDLDKNKRLVNQDWIIMNISGHSHQHPSKNKVINRMARIIGHMNSIKTMVENDRDCTEVLLQIVAVRSALTNCGKVLLNDHVQHCVKEAVIHKDSQKIDDLCKTLDKFIR